MSYKIFKKLALALLCIFTLAACQTNSTTTETKETKEVTTEENKQEPKVEQSKEAEAPVENKITLTLNDGEKEIKKEEIAFEAGNKLGEVMEKNLKIEKDPSNFITAIEEIYQNPEENLWWTYSINGEEATVGAFDYELKPGDSIIFTLTKYEG